MKNASLAVRYIEKDPSADGIVFDVEIAGEKKTVVFKGSDDYRTCGEPVFVQIPDGPHWNRVRRGKLVLFKFQNE